MSEPVQDADALRRRADSLRDQRLWREAAAAYGAFLALRPEDAGMRVQQGHCLKEAGDLEGALALYREAAAQRPRDADIPLQIGHAEKLRGRMDAAREAYARAVLLAPGAQNPWREWSALMRQEAGRVTAPAGGVVLDLSDLAAWVRGGRRAPSGIQRVQLDLVRAALGRAVPPRLCAMPPGAGGMGGGGWRDWPVALFTRIDHLMTSGADAEDPEWRAAALLLEGVLSAAPPLRFAPGAVLAPLGGSWSQPDHLACLRAARARDGLRHVPLLHDCIPLLLPEHCAERVTQDYARWFSALPLHAEGVVAVSQATAEDMRALMARHLPDLPVPPAAVLRLDAAPRAVVPEPHPIAAAGRPYVLFVSTIEGRKNHLMVFNAWLALLRRLGAAAVPLLVCVGRPGWRAGAAMSLLEASTALRGKVRLLSDVSDPQLAALYQGCLFTLYNSHHEGWGLPVTESLAHGRLALVPAHSALTEAGEGGALFFAPGSEPDLVAQLTRLITEPGFRAAAEAAIRPPGRDWAAVADRFLTEAARLAATAPPPPAPCPAPGLPHPLARLEGEAPGLPMALAEALRDGEGWHPLEAWGCWTRPGPARLCLELPPGMEGALEVQIGLRAPEGAAVEADLLPLREGAPPAGARRVALP
ncbi:glycosyltransferase, partial [Roseomonas sp. GC11]|uniref:glycosyltransferase n=1 Tax=Roseomonas sp. GC11 TaxID=2950546 RepID=UPI00210B4A49